VNAAELVVVRDEEDLFDKKILLDLERTQKFKCGVRTGRYPIFDSAHLPLSSEKLSENLPSIPGYRFLKPIGMGSEPSVFLVEQLRDGAILALKFVDGSVSEDNDVLFAFVEEYGLLEQIRHPNVLRICDQGVTDDVLFILSEYLPGGTIQQYIGNNGMKLEQAWNVLHDIARALAEINRVGIVHRDIKPEKIMLRSDGTAVLGDFGVARRIMKARQSEHIDYVLDSSYYMSPELAKGEKDDDRSDVYSMGAVFFNMLTGELPYSGIKKDDIVQQHAYAPIPKLPQQYLHLQSLLNRMMAKDKNDRYTSNELLIYMDRLKEAL
jgi:serine/threonine-protein kinase PpkA